MPPTTRYAKKGEISIAYQVVGEGPVDLVLVNGLVSHMALMWSDPAANAMLRRLTSFSRLIMFDKPGTGLSDPVAGPPSVEQRVEDIQVVMDAVGVDQACLLGYSEGGSPAALFAATHPERCEALVLLETAARWIAAPDHLPDHREDLERMWSLMFEGAERWGEGEVFRHWAPSASSVPGVQQALGSAERICASPGMARALLHACPRIDVRAALPGISAPVLVVHNEGSFIRAELGRALAAEIPHAKLALFPGVDHLIWMGSWEPMIDEIEEFLTGARHRSDPDRVLATIVFTDIVASTEKAVQLGDERWRALVERHDEITRAELARYGGRAIKALGDGFLAAFEGPGTAVRCARALSDGLRSLGIEIRAAVHTGECERRGDDLAGIALNVAARILPLAGAGEVLASSTVRELVLGSGLEFEERGSHTLKGVPGEWRIFAVTGDGRTDARPVSEVDPATAALTPGPLETLRPRDRAILAAANRAPALTRAFGRVAQRTRRTG